MTTPLGCVAHRNDDLLAKHSKSCLQERKFGRLIRIENAVSGDPDLCPGSTYVEANLDGLLRADARGRADVYTAALNPTTGWLRHVGLSMPKAAAKNWSAVWLAASRVVSAAVGGLRRPANSASVTSVRAIASAALVEPGRQAPARLVHPVALTRTVPARLAG